MRKKYSKINFIVLITFCFSGFFFSVSEVKGQTFQDAEISAAGCCGGDFSLGAVRKIYQVNVWAQAYKNRGGGYKLGIALLKGGQQVAYIGTAFGGVGQELAYARSGFPNWAWGWPWLDGALNFGGVEADTIRIRVIYYGCAGGYHHYIRYRYDVSPPPPPTGLSASCPSPGTSATVSWNAVSGATYYALRINNQTNGWNGLCDGGQLPGDICQNVSATSFSFSSQPGATYNWWLHACNAYGCSGATGGPNFTCAANPKGWHDGSDCNSSWGWACDADNYNQALDIHFYRDGPAGSGVFIGSVSANQPREAGVGAECGGNSNHGFIFTTPDSLKDGQTHSIYAYAINIGSGTTNPLLSGSPKSITCAPTCTPSCGSWSACSVACGGGTQTRTCTRADCNTYTESQSCNTQPCAPPSVDIKANGVDGYIVIDYNTSVTISWTSTNASSCTISPNNWTGTSGSQSTGNLTSSQLYTAICTGLGGSASDSVTVFVMQPTLTINPASATLKIGEKKQFQALYDPDGFTGPQAEQDVTISANWSSDNSGTAKVNNSDKKGEAEGVAAGSTFIRAAYSGLTAPALIDVQKKSFWLFWKEIIPW